MATLTAIRIEGGLLGPDVLDQLLAGELPGQRPADFGITGRRGLTEEIAAIFADVRALWGVFQHRLERLPENDLATTVTRDAWAIPFFGLLGFELRYNQRAYEVDGQSFAVSHRAGEADDAPPVHIVGAGQKLGVVAASGRPRLAPHSLVQEFLNRTEQVWGIVTNGATLRLLRNSNFVRRQAYVEFDLRAILEDQRFQDFAVLYRLLHRTRLPGPAEANACFISQYYDRSVEQGGRVREHLREGVEECIRQLANGFLRHPDNPALRCRVARSYSGHAAIRPEALYRQLLKLIYRLLFLLVAEDRGLLSPDPIYREHYGIARLRRLVDHLASFNAYDDLWQSLRVLWRVLTKEELASVLRLAPLNGELFAPLDLDEATIDNRDLLSALWHLVYYQEGSASPRRVNYAALDVEELGSVYESLLEFHPAIDPDSSSVPVFALVAGSERKTTGSYYTKPELVAELIKSALEPVLADRLAAALATGREAAVLNIRVCDPACGSGHFLLATARRLGRELARIRTGEDEPSPERTREAIRDVIGHSIYGVDKNPLAVDLCRVALWLESHVGDRPLTFLDRRIRIGDSLVGVFDLKVLAAGIPDEAFKSVEGDDKETAGMLARRNRNERQGQRDLAWEPSAALTTFGQLSTEIEDIRDDTPQAVRRKATLFQARFSDPAWLRQKEACDLWTAAFFQPRRPGSVSITTSSVLDRLQGKPVSPQVMGAAIEEEARNRFFHWPLEFPEVFAAGGFDVIVGNPPWDTMSPDVKEFFAPYDQSVRSLSPEEQKERVEVLLKLPGIQESWDAYCHRLYVAAKFFKASGRYKLFAPGNLGKGDFNIYRMFVEFALKSVNPNGRVAQYVPENLYNGANAAAIRAYLFENCQLKSLIVFDNAKNIWFDIYYRSKFCLYTAIPGGRTLEFSSAFGINSREKLAALSNGLPITIPVTLVKEFSAEALAIAEVAHPSDISISQKLYARLPKFGDYKPRSSARPYMREVDMGNDQGDFEDDALGVPVYEGRMVEAFDHRAKAYVSGRGRSAVWRELEFGSSVKIKAIVPQWHISAKNIPDKLGDRSKEYRIAFCDAGGVTNARFLMAALVPPNVVCGHSVPTILFDPADDRLAMLWLGVANSFCVDFLARKKAALHMTYTVLDSLPLPIEFRDTHVEQAIAQRALVLTATGTEMTAFWTRAAAQLGIDAEASSPVEDPAQRDVLRAELDVLVARDLLGLSWEEMRYVLDPGDVLGSDCGFETFGALKRAEMRASGGLFTSRERIKETWQKLLSKNKLIARPLVTADPSE